MLRQDTVTKLIRRERINKFDLVKSWLIFEFLKQFTKWLPLAKFKFLFSTHFYSNSLLFVLSKSNRRKLHLKAR